MKKLLTFTLLLVSFSVYSQFNRDPYRDATEGNFYLRNGQVFYQRTYNTPVSFDALEKKLTSYNTPNAGFQIKKTDGNKMSGVLLNYHFNWTHDNIKARKVPQYLKSPANATFEVEKTDGAYRVTVNNIWFSNTDSKNQKHLTLESIVTGKSGVVFTKEKRPLRVLNMIDGNLQWIFQMQGITKDTRF